MEKQHQKTSPTSRIRLGFIAFGAMLACFAVGLDDSIVSTVVPTIASKFHSLSQIGWYGSAYFLPQAVLQPFFGNLYLICNTKIIYLTSLAIFEVGSLIAAKSPTSNVLIMGRILSGVGAAGLGIGGLQILKMYIEERLQSLFIGIVFAVLGISTCLGPLLGGLITDSIGWRWCFWINLPIGALVLFTMAIGVTIKTKPIDTTIKVHDGILRKIVKMDILGTTFLSVALITLLLGLQFLCDHPLNLLDVSEFFAGSVVAGFAWAGQQILRTENKMFPLRILRHTWPICGFMFFLSGATTSQLYYLPFFCQSILGKSPRASGVLTIAYAASMSIGALVSAITMTYFPYTKIISLTGAALVGTAGGLFSTLTTNDTTSHIIGYQVIAGFGVGLCLLLLSVCPKLMTNENDVALAQCSVIFFQILGGALGVQVSNVIFANLLHTKIQRLNVSDQTLASITSDLKMLRNDVPADLLPGVLEAFRSTIRLVFIYTIVTCSVAFLFGWFIKNKPGIPNHGLGHASDDDQDNILETRSQIELVH